MSYLDPDHKKIHATSKIMLSAGPVLDKKIDNVINTVYKLVGSTLGPNGRPVAIQRSEPGLLPTVTKDGVSVVKALGFNDTVEETIFELFKDAAVKTVENSGDGTSSASILAYAILKNMKEYLKKNPKVSSQIAIREIEKYFQEVCLPYIDKKSTKINIHNYDELLFNVANISTNGDKELAAVIIKAFKMVGNGHITLTEENGNPGFVLDKTSGLAFGKGYDESCGIFANEFLNDQVNNRVYLEKPKLILVDGNILDLAGCAKLFELIEQDYNTSKDTTTNYVLISHSFNKQVVATLAQSFKKSLFKIVPCLTPLDGMANSRYDFLLDLAAFVNGKIFNSLNTPISQGVPLDLGFAVESFEMSRFRSVVHGKGQETSVLKRLDDLQKRKDSPGTSGYEKSILSERIGRLSGGIAKITIKHVSDGQAREIRDHAEDAVCACRGALSKGVLPGGCRILLDLALETHKSESDLIKSVLGKSFSLPLNVLLDNCGMNDDEKKNILDQLINDQNLVYDALKNEFGDAFSLGLLDSTLAVSEALKSAVGIASQLGTLGGIVVYPRDNQLEREFSTNQMELQREANDYQPQTDVMGEEF